MRSSLVTLGLAGLIALASCTSPKTKNPYARGKVDHQDFYSRQERQKEEERRREEKIEEITKGISLEEAIEGIQKLEKDPEIAAECDKYKEHWYVDEYTQILNAQIDSYVFLQTMLKKARGKLKQAEKKAKAEEIHYRQQLDSARLEVARQKFEITEEGGEAYLKKLRRIDEEYNQKVDELIESYLQSGRGLDDAKASFSAEEYHINKKVSANYPESCSDLIRQMRRFPVYHLPSEE